MLALVNIYYGDLHREAEETATGLLEIANYCLKLLDCLTPSLLQEREAERVRRLEAAARPRKP